MARFLDEQLDEDLERIKYETYLEEAKAKVNPDIIPDDEGMVYWDFLCLFMDCTNHEFSRYWRVKDQNLETTNLDQEEEEELRLAAECEVICKVLSCKPKFCFN